MMRLAAVLMVAVLMTTCAISGTFAKYITQDDANDSARVAKFGVEVKADGSLFENAYLNAPVAKDDTTATVVAFDSLDVVAPGTNNAENSFKFSITGKPEVDVKVDVVVTDNGDDVFLKAGTYEDLTTGNPDDQYVLAQDYYPVKYTLWDLDKATDNKIVDGGTLAQLSTALTNLSNTKIDANTNLTDTYGNYEITWTWDFEVNDKADTILGDLAAGTPVAGLNGVELVDGTDYNLNTGLKISITVTQIN